MYRAIDHFHDLQDGEHEYKPGDKFPREGMKVSEARLAELSGDYCKRGKPVIEFVPDKAPAKKRTAPKE